MEVPENRSEATLKSIKVLENRSEATLESKSLRKTGRSDFILVDLYQKTLVCTCWRLRPLRDEVKKGFRPSNISFYQTNIVCQ